MINTLHTSHTLDISLEIKFLFKFNSKYFDGCLVLFSADRLNKKSILVNNSKQLKIKHQSFTIDNIVLHLYTILFFYFKLN